MLMNWQIIPDLLEVIQEIESLRMNNLFKLQAEQIKGEELFNLVIKEEQTHLH